MRALITGATGFIGSRLTLRCLQDGHAVRVLGQNRNPVEDDNARLLESKGAEVVIGSITERSGLDRAVADVDVVFHLAAAQHEANVPDQHFRDVNVDGTRNMLEASVQAGVGRFVHGSTIGVYGYIPGSPVRNDSPERPDNIYGVTKLEAEQVIREYRERLDCVVLRISETYGPGDHRLVKLFRGVQQGRFPMIGRGDNLHHLVYIDDLIDGLLLAAEVEGAVGQTFLLAGSKAVSTREMVETVARRLGASPPKIRLPLGLLMLVARLTEMGLRPLGIQPPLHPRRMNFYVKSFEFSIEDAQERLGYSPRIDFEQGVDETAAWYREQGILVA